MCEMKSWKVRNETVPIITSRLKREAVGNGCDKARPILYITYSIWNLIESYHIIRIQSLKFNFIISFPFQFFRKSGKNFCKTIEFYSDGLPPFYICCVRVCFDSVLIIVSKLWSPINSRIFDKLTKILMKTQINMYFCKYLFYCTFLPIRQLIYYFST